MFVDRKLATPGANRICSYALTLTRACLYLLVHIDGNGGGSRSVASGSQHGIKNIIHRYYDYYYNNNNNNNNSGNWYVVVTMVKRHCRRLAMANGASREPKGNARYSTTLCKSPTTMTAMSGPRSTRRCRQRSSCVG